MPESYFDEISLFDRLFAEGKHKEVLKILHQLDETHRFFFCKSTPSFGYKKLVSNGYIFARSEITNRRL